jgi:hypothetical protein
MSRAGTTTLALACSASGGSGTTAVPKSGSHRSPQGSPGSTNVTSSK